MPTRNTKSPPSRRSHPPQIGGDRGIAGVAQRDFHPPPVDGVDHPVDQLELVEMVDPALRGGHRRVRAADQRLDVHRPALLMRDEQREQHVPGGFVEQFGGEMVEPRLTLRQQLLGEFAPVERRDDGLRLAGAARRAGETIGTRPELHRDRGELRRQVFDQSGDGLMWHVAFPKRRLSIVCLPFEGRKNTTI